MWPCPQYLSLRLCKQSDMMCAVSLFIRIVVVIQLLSCIQLFCDPMDCSLPGSPVHGIFLARILEWVTISFFQGSSRARNWTPISCIDRWIFYDQTTIRISMYCCCSVTQSCPTLCDPIDCSTPGLPVHHQLLEFTHSCPLSWWCHPIISSSVARFSSSFQSFPASGSLPKLIN